MCKKPRRIVNPSKWIDPYKTQSLYIDVPCGKCSECIISYRNDWRNRSYYESLDTFLKGGYILFDTLTYRNGNLPHLSDWLNVPKDCDFPCFSKFDLDLFFANLRRKLRKYDVANNIRYFVGCEYGDDIRFSRRPHYHVLFFVNTSIPVQKMSCAIASSWSNGRTDGVPYRGLNYVYNHCYFTNLSDSEKFSVNYVTKYCTKNFSYNNLVEFRLNRLLHKDFNLWCEAQKFIIPQHFQSKSFGLDSLIKIVGKKNLLETGAFKIIQKNGLYRYVNLSKSVQRKLLYDYSRDEFGQVHWKLNEDGFAYKKRFFMRQIDYLAKRVAGTNKVSFADAKKEVFNLFFRDWRFNSGDVSYVIDNSYNVDSGFRNYSSKDYSFMRRKCFAYSDFGSDSLGYRKGVVFNRNDLESFNDVAKLCVRVSCPNVIDYQSKVALNGDGQLDVLKLLDHLKFVHNKNLYD